MNQVLVPSPPLARWHNLLIAPRYDLGYPIPLRSAASPVWDDLEVLFPGQRPRFVEPGSLLWLRRGDRFVRSYEVARVEHREQRWSDVDELDRGPGPAVVLVQGSGRRRNRPLSKVADPDGTSGSWSRGIRYLAPGGHAFVHPNRAARPSTRRPRKSVTVVTGPLERADAEEVEIVSSAAERIARRTEQQLVRRYREWLRGRGGDLVRVRFDLTDGRRLAADGYDPSSQLLVEAKGSVRRNDIRMAIGQLFDYQRLMGHPVALAVLLPEYPAVDIVELLHSIRITVIWPSGDGFEERRSAEDGLATDRPDIWVARPGGAED